MIARLPNPVQCYQPPAVVIKQFKSWATAVMLAGIRLLESLFKQMRALALEIEPQEPSVGPGIVQV